MRYFNVFDIWFNFHVSNFFIQLNVFQSAEWELVCWRESIFMCRIWKKWAEERSMECKICVAWKTWDFSSVLTFWRLAGSNSYSREMKRDCSGFCGIAAWWTGPSAVERVHRCTRWSSVLPAILWLWAQGVCPLHHLWRLDETFCQKEGMYGWYPLNFDIVIDAKLSFYFSSSVICSKM